MSSARVSQHRFQPGVIDIFYVDLDKGAPSDSNYELLSQDELERANRFFFAKHRNRFIARRGILRKLLSNYLSTSPRALQFQYSEYGKPDLAAQGSGRIGFSLSYSDNVAIFAFTQKTELGIDIEHVRQVPEMEQLVQRFFSARENLSFASVPKSQKEEAFFNCWTAKEAFIKAVGAGLSYPLKEFDVSLIPGEPARIIQIKGDKEATSEWSIHRFETFPGYRASLVAKRSSLEISISEWQSKG